MILDFLNIHVTNILIMQETPPSKVLPWTTVWLRFTNPTVRWHGLLAVVLAGSASTQQARPRIPPLVGFVSHPKISEVSKKRSFRFGCGCDSFFWMDPPERTIRGPTYTVFSFFMVYLAGVSVTSLSAKEVAKRAPTGQYYIGKIRLSICIALEGLLRRALDQKEFRHPLLSPPSFCVIRWGFKFFYSFFIQLSVNWRSIIFCVSTVWHNVRYQLSHFVSEDPTRYCCY